jgi:hypothetical protein
MNNAAEIPYIGIWYRPRATIRHIVDTDPRRGVIALVVFGAVLGAIGEWATGNPTAFKIGTHSLGVFQAHTWTALNLVLIGVSPFVGIAILYMYAALIRWAGGLIGGTGTAVELRAAYAWGLIPGVAGSVLYVIAGCLGWTHIVIPEPSKGHPSSLGIWTQFLSPAFLPIGILSLWGIVVRIKCFSEVHRFSAWKGLGAYLIVTLTMMGMGALIGILIPLVVLVTHISL